MGLISRHGEDVGFLEDLVVRDWEEVVVLLLVSGALCQCVPRLRRLSGTYSLMSRWASAGETLPSEKGG